MKNSTGINLKKEEMTNMDFLLEAVGIVAAMIYLGLQIYYGIVYGVAFTGIILNAAILILVYVGLTLLARYPERVNNLPKVYDSYGARSQADLRAQSFIYQYL